MLILILKGFKHLNTVIRLENNMGCYIVAGDHSNAQYYNEMFKETNVMMVQNIQSIMVWNIMIYAGW